MIWSRGAGERESAFDFRDEMVHFHPRQRVDDCDREELECVSGKIWKTLLQAEIS